MSDNDIYKVGDKPVQEFKINDNLHFKEMVVESLQRPTAMPQLTIWSDNERGWHVAVSQQMIDNQQVRDKVAGRLLEVIKRLNLFETVSQKADF